MELMLHKVRLAYADAVYEPKAMANDANSKPAFSCKLIVEPGSDNAKALAEAVRKVARENPKWGSNWESILEDLTKKGRVAYIEGPYCDKDGKPRDGFEGKYHLSCRSEKLRPSIRNRFNQVVTSQSESGAPYSGSLVHASVDIYAFDHPQWGRRINCTLQGLMFAEDGQAFGGGRPADDSTFASVAATPVAEDFV